MNSFKRAKFANYLDKRLTLKDSHGEVMNFSEKMLTIIESNDEKLYVSKMKHTTENQSSRQESFFS